jgi:PKD repeat protein
METPQGSRIGRVVAHAGCPPVSPIRTEEVLKPNLDKASGRKGIAPLAIVLAVATLLALPLIATAAHWPQFGGDLGHSGYQPIDEGKLPIYFKYQTSDYSQTSIVTTGGGPVDVQRMAYGFVASGFPDNNATVKLKRLDNGVQTAAIDIDDESPHSDDPAITDDDDAFGVGPQFNVTPLDTSTSTPGDLYVVHNDDNQANDSDPNAGGNDIGIAQIDIATNTLVQDVSFDGDIVPLPGSADGFTIQSSPVMSGDLGGGDREIYFVAADGADERLFKISIDNKAQGSADTLSFDVSDADIDANPAASPTFATFLDPGTGSPIQYVVVPTRSGVKTFRRQTIDGAGPSVNLGGPTFTPSFPVNSDGSTNAEPGSFYVATAPENAAGKTIVYKLGQNQSDPLNQTQLTTFVKQAESAQLDGTPGQAMALAAEGSAAGRVLVPTSLNLYSLSTATLAGVNRFTETVGAGSPTFALTQPVASGDLAFFVSDGGDQYVANSTTLDRVSPGADGFPVAAAALDSTASRGQPSLSRGRIQFPMNNGIFVYILDEEPEVPPTVTITSPGDGAKLAPNAAFTVTADAADARGIEKVDFTFDGTTVTDTTAPYSAAFNSTGKAEGMETITAVATDASGAGVGLTAVGNTASDEITVEVDNVPNPTAAFTFSPGSPQPTGTEFTFDATTSAGSAEDQAITKYEWDFDGDGTFDKEGNADEAKVVKHTYAQNGTFSPTLRVTQTSGGTDEERKNNAIVIENRPPVSSFTVAPNPAQINQTVSFDGSASADQDGSVSKYEWDFDGNGTFDQTTTEPKTTTTYGSGGKRSVTLRVTDDDGGTNTSTRDVEVAGANSVPSASFTANPNPAGLNTQVVFDGSASRDPDGSIVKFEWDLDGNGAFEVDSGSNPRTQRAYATAGVINVKLRVTDNAGARTETVRQLTVTAAAQTPKPRATPRSLSARTTPARDRSLPYVFKTTGRLGLPSGVTRVNGCKGRVTVTVKAGKKTISRRTTSLRTSCSYSSQVTFRDRKRIGTATRVRVTARFQGNAALSARSSRTHSVRVG